MRVRALLHATSIHVTLTVCDYELLEVWLEVFHAIEAYVFV